MFFLFALAATTFTDLGIVLKFFGRQCHDVLVLIFLHQFLNRTHIGRAIRAASDDSEIAPLMGTEGKQAGAVRMARVLGRGHVIVTILCDSGLRNRQRLFNREFLAGRGLVLPEWLKLDACNSS